MLPPTISWLNEAFVEKVLRAAKEDEFLKVTSLALEAATKPGENCLSDMVRATVEYTRDQTGSKKVERKSLMVKISPSFNEKLASELDVYNTEIRATGTALVFMNDFVKDEGYRLSPIVYHTDNGKTPYIVMEDMADLGYRMADRLVGLDLAHCLVALRGLARFHASSVALWEKDPEVVTSFTKGIFHEDRPDMVKTMFGLGVKSFAKAVKEWSELGNKAQSYSERLLKISENCYDKAAECAKPKASEFCVLIHGDCWVNNMLFRYDNAGKVVDNIFVDFQMPWWSSPVVDIINLFNTSLSMDVEDHHRDTVIEEYSKTLTATMSRLGCKTKAPTLDYLKQSLVRYQFLELMIACVYMPLTTRPSKETVLESAEEVFDKFDTYANDSYRSPVYRRRMLRRLPEWEANGILDV